MSPKAYRFSVPYDFCATLLDMTMTVRSPKASRLGERTYWSRYGLEAPGAPLIEHHRGAARLHTE